MVQKKTVRRALAFALASLFLACNFAPSVFSRQDTAPASHPRAYDVQHYVIRTSFDVAHKTVIGEVEVTLKPLSAGLKAFELDATNMKIEQVSLASGATLASIMRGEKLLITLDRAYEPADSITVRIKYRAHPDRGLYFVTQSREDGYRRPAQIYTQGEPEDNHHWFPCYDFPDDKATSEQYITTGANELAIANGKLIETTGNADGTRTFHWLMDQPHSTYLISLIVGDYAKLSDSYKNVPLDYYTYRGTEEQARRAFGKTPEMINWFSRVLSYDFPYNKYTQTIVGNFIFGGMENITATTFADTEILYADESIPGATSVDLVSHELAHSWFGDLVTCRDWAHLWLNEGFATFMEASFREHQGGREAYLYSLQADAKEYFSEDPSHKRHPLVNTRYPLSMELFDATTYKKGAIVIHMLRETVGDELFWKALNVYLNEFKYRNAETRDLQRVFERVTGQQLEWFFDQWVYKAGYPELRVRSNYNPAQGQLTLNVTQTQKPDSNTPTVFRLPVEIEIVTASGSRTERIEINQRIQSFTFKLDGPPRMITFDKGARLLKKLDFPQTRAASAYLLIDGADLTAQKQAARAYSASNDVHASNIFLSEDIQSDSALWSWTSIGRVAEKSMR
jgi:aminopeptidase N